MPICKICEKSFPNRVVIDGKARILNTRKYCLECSPFGEHNTKKLDIPLNREYKCSKCGETDPSKFYGNKRFSCGKCHNEYTKERARQNKLRMVEYMGGCCVKCGYSKSIYALDFHHIDPTTKCKNFGYKNGWKWERVKEELEKCTMLCRNCHSELHYDITL